MKKVFQGGENYSWNVGVTERVKWFVILFSIQLFILE